MPEILLSGGLAPPPPKFCYINSKSDYTDITEVGKDWNWSLSSFFSMWVDFGNSKWFKSTVTENSAMGNPEGRGMS